MIYLMERYKKADPSEKRRVRITLCLLLLILLTALSVTVPFLIKRRRSEMRLYSGAQVNQSSQLLYDVDRLGEFRVVSSRKQPDGRYSEYIVVQNAIDVRLWRDFERPKLPCREQMKEKYPDLSGYVRQKAPEDAIYCDRGDFTVTDTDGGKTSHTAVLLRRDGWDYLVDCSVKQSDRESFANQIDQIINHMFLVP